MRIKREKEEEKTKKEETMKVKKII